MANNCVLLEGTELKLIQRPIPVIKNQNDVVVQVKYAGMCGTDISIWNRKFDAANVIIPGHEFAGIIHEVGNNVKNVKVGDKVVINPYNWCNSCHFCMDGRPNLCSVYGMKTGVGYFVDGGFQNYCLVPSNLIHHVPEDMELKNAVWVQPLSTVYRGIENLRNQPLNRKFFIAGAGPISMLFSIVLHHMGYRDVTVTDVVEARLNSFNALGLQYTTLLGKDLYQIVDEKRKTDIEFGFDVFIDCTGFDESMSKGIQYLRAGGSALLFGVMPKGKLLSFDQNEFYAKELTFVSSRLNPFNYDKVISLVTAIQHHLDWKRMDVKEFRLQEYNEAYSSLNKRTVTKAIFNMDLN